MHCCSLFFNDYSYSRDLPSFPTRRSSDLLPGFDRVNAMRSCAVLIGRSLFTTRTFGNRMTVVMGANVLVVNKDLPIKTARSEEHTSELQSLRHLVCRLLLEKKK